MLPSDRRKESSPKEPTRNVVSCKCGTQVNRADDCVGTSSTPWDRFLVAALVNTMINFWSSQKPGHCPTVSESLCCMQRAFLMAVPVHKSMLPFIRLHSEGF
jgi:hypothetical protein